jgi:transposase-like protein
VRVGGRWNYLFRAVDKHSPLIDFMLPDRRNTRAAYRFLRKALKTMSDYPPERITTDKLASSLWAPHDCIIAQEQESSASDEKSDPVSVASQQSLEPS